jgi:hypothetical protein
VQEKKIEDYFSQQGKVLVRITTAHTRFVFAELDIGHPMQIIFTLQWLLTAFNAS